MVRFARFVVTAATIAWALVCGSFPGTLRPLAAAKPHSNPAPAQETGFLNRKVEVHGTTYRFQVYLPEEWRRDDHKQWPIILFLHGRGERGSEGMWQTQIGLPSEVRDHPDRWPFIIVMPQCPFTNYWTDPEMLGMAMAALDQEAREFHTDPERTYLTGLSLGGYGAWELARLHPQRWAAIAIAAGGIFWSYAPERWQQSATLPAQYARPLVHTPVWLFHGSQDNVVVPRESELMFDAFRADGGRIRLWIYQGLRHDCWDRAYNEPELPRWLLAHRLGSKPEPPPLAERVNVPLHPPAIKLSTSQLDSLVGEYRDQAGHLAVMVLRQGDQLYQKDLHGDIDELAAETPSTFFYPNGRVVSRLIFERDPQGKIVGALFRDDRHEERWEKRGGR